MSRSIVRLDNVFNDSSVITAIQVRPAYSSHTRSMHMDKHIFCWTKASMECFEKKPVLSRNDDQTVVIIRLSCPSDSTTHNSGGLSEYK